MDCCIPTRSPKCIGTCTISIAVPGHSSLTCGLGAKTSKRARLLHLTVVVPHRLNVVAIRIESEGSVVTRPVVAIAGGAVVLASRGQGCLVETMDLLAAARFEGHVRGYNRLLFGDPEVRVLPV